MAVIMTEVFMLLGGFPQTFHPGVGHTLRDPQATPLDSSRSTSHAVKEVAFPRYWPPNFHPSFGLLWLPPRKSQTKRPAESVLGSKRTGGTAGRDISRKYPDRMPGRSGYSILTWTVGLKRQKASCLRIAEGRQGNVLCLFRRKVHCERPIGQPTSPPAIVPPRGFGGSANPPRPDLDCQSPSFHTFLESHLSKIQSKSICSVKPQSS